MYYHHLLVRIRNNILTILGFTLLVLFPQYIVNAFCFDSYQSIYCKTVLQANPGVVTTLDNRMHGLQTGDKVTFKEIVGMTVLNGSEQTVKGKKLSVKSLFLEF